MQITMNQLHEFTGLDRRTIKKRLDGLNPIGRKGKADAYESAVALRRCYLPAGTKDGTGLDYRAEKARLDKEKADNMALKNKQLRKELLPAGQVQKFWTDHVINARTKIAAIPDKATPRVADIRSKVKIKKILRQMIVEVLEDLANSVEN